MRTRASPFTHDFLLLFAGPVVWAVHFLVLYGITGLLCARPAQREALLGVDLAAWGLVVLAVIACAAIVGALMLRPRDPAAPHGRIIRSLSRGLGLLALVAIAWETLALLLVPFCG